MVLPREGLLGSITVLDEDGHGTVTASGAEFVNVNGVVHAARGSAPTTGAGTGAFWIETGSPTIAKFTDSAGTTIDIGPGDGGGSWADVLSAGNLSGGNNPTISSGDIITSESGSSLTLESDQNIDINAVGLVNINGNGYVSGNFEIDGKLTVAGLIDPTGMVFDNQETVPGEIPDADKSTLWVRSADDSLILTNDFGTDIEVGIGVTDGYGDPIDGGFFVKRIKRFSIPLDSIGSIELGLMSYSEYISKLGFSPDVENPGNRTSISFKAWVYTSKATNSVLTPSKSFREVLLTDYGDGVNKDLLTADNAGATHVQISDMNLDSSDGFTITLAIDDDEAINVVVQYEILTSGSYTENTI